jgi:hypothetical protein
MFNPHTNQKPLKNDFQGLILIYCYFSVLPQ